MVEYLISLRKTAASRISHPSPVNNLQLPRRCGVCGDAYDEPKPQHHETGGNFGNKVITKTYVKDTVIDIEIELTANHKGRFELKLCPVAAGRREATQECLDRWGTGRLGYRRGLY